MKKLDFKKELKHLYNPSTNNFVLVEVPKMNFLMIDGQGDPNISQDYKDAMEAIYSVSYTLKFKIKKGRPPRDYVVMPLEGLWWAEDMDDFLSENKERWEWTAMLMQPEYVTKELYLEASEEAGKKKDLPALPIMRFEEYDEGLSAQIMYIGPYADEGPTIAKLHKFIEDEGHERRGKHHEIYLSDPRRTKPERLKTVIRQPVK